MSGPGKHAEAIPIGVVLPQSAVQHVQGQRVQVSALEEAVAAPVPATDVERREAGCDCSVPPDARPEVRVARSWSAAVIVTHVIALMAFGLSLFQVVASLCGIVAGGVLLGCYQRDIYTCIPLTFFFCVVLDLTAATLWVSHGAVIVAVFPMVAALVTALAILYVAIASASWEESAGAMNAHPQAIVVSRGTAQATVVQHAPQYVQHAPQDDRIPTVYV